jgi:membrane-bound metal-dependent hydrolase YbcI (DUF457 family)
MAALLVATAGFFALLPDIDTDSVGRRVAYTGLVLVDATLLLAGHMSEAALLGFFALLPAAFAHRAWTHTWWAMLAASLLVLALPWWLTGRPVVDALPFFCMAAAGYGSHLVLDGRW